MSNRPSIIKADNPYLNSPDALSTVLSRLQLSAEVQINAEYCGNWAFNYSGSRKIPFHLIGRGDAWLHVKGKAVKNLSVGDLVFFPRDDDHWVTSSKHIPEEHERESPSLYHSNRDQGDATHMICGYFEFENKAAWPLLDSLPSVVHMDMSDVSVTSQTRAIIDLMVGELKQQQPGFYNTINHLAYLLFVQVLRLQIESGKIKSGLLAALFDSKISLALCAIHNHPEKRWTIESLASEALMGRSSFAQRFHELTSVPPMQYLTEWRMQEASSLLKNTNASLMEIAERCGYESEAAFRKAFKKVVGVPPGQLRKQEIRKQDNGHLRQAG